MGINGAFAAIGGVVVLLVASNARAMQRHGLAQGPFLAFGFVLLTVGLLELLLVYALFGGSNVARIVATVVFGLSLVYSVVAVLVGGPGALASWITGVLDVIVLVGLWGTPGAQGFFRSREAPARAIPPPPSPPSR
jgi:hypothetical protein